MSGDLFPAVLGVALVAAAAAFALLPFARGSASVAASADSVDTKTDRYALYQQVLELEFDYQLGKLSATDFQQISSELLTQAGASLREERGNLDEIDREIEREVAAARAAFAAARRSGLTEAETVS